MENVRIKAGVIKQILLLMVLTVLISGVGVFSSAGNAHAAQIEPQTSAIMLPGSKGSSEVSASTFVGKNDSLVHSVVTSVNQSEGVNILNYDLGTGILTFDNKTYSELPNEAKQSYMRKALKTTQDTGLNAQRKNKVYNFISSQDTTVSSVITRFSQDVKADSAGAFAVLSPLQKGFAIFLGLVSVLTIMALTMSIVIDISYLVVPFVSNMADRDDATEGKRGISPWFISDAARHAKKVSDNSIGTSEYRSSVWIYMKARVLQVALVVILTMALVLGSIYDFIGLIGDMFGF